MGLGLDVLSFHWHEYYRDTSRLDSILHAKRRRRLNVPAMRASFEIPKTSLFGMYAMAICEWMRRKAVKCSPGRGVREAVIQFFFIASAQQDYDRPQPVIVLLKIEVRATQLSKNVLRCSKLIWLFLMWSRPRWCLFTGNSRINTPLNIPKGNTVLIQYLWDPCPGGGIREQVRDSWQTLSLAACSAHKSRPQA